VATEQLEHAVLTVESPLYELEVVAGEQQGERVMVTETVTIGSGPQCSLVLRDGAVSQLHVKISPGEQGALVEDLNSRNGLFLAANRVQSFLVRDEARFRIGRSTLRLARISKRLNSEKPESFGGAISVSKRMKRVFLSLQQAARGDTTVLLVGETGTGKEVLASAVHANSRRQAGPYVVVDCGTLAPDTVESQLFGHVKGSFSGATDNHQGLLPSAHLGTVFLDEIGELPLETQTRLLRFLNEGEVRAVGSTVTQKLDVRIIAATHRDLRKMIEAKQFRADLFYRLSALTVEIPPLRERPEDIELLVKHALAEKGQGDFEVSPELLAHLVAHQWPGNIRELHNVVEQVLLGTFAQARTAEDDGFRGAKNQLFEVFTRQYFEAVYKKTNGNISEIARISKMNRTWVHELLTRIGVHKIK
jgi:DNA-binding NtrC family response regulator